MVLIAAALMLVASAATAVAYPRCSYGGYGSSWHHGSYGYGSSCCRPSYYGHCGHYRRPHHRYGHHRYGHHRYRRHRYSHHHRRHHYRPSRYGYGYGWYW